MRDPEETRELARAIVEAQEESRFLAKQFRHGFDKAVAYLEHASYGAPYSYRVNLEEKSYIIEIRRIL